MAPIQECYSTVACRSDRRASVAFSCSSSVLVREDAEPSLFLLIYYHSVFDVSRWSRYGSHFLDRLAAGEAANRNYHCSRGPQDEAKL